MSQSTDDLERRLRALSGDLQGDVRPVEATLALGQRRRTRRRRLGLLGTSAFLLAAAAALVNVRPVGDSALSVGDAAPSTNSEPVVDVQQLTSAGPDGKGRECVRISVGAASQLGCLTMPGESLWKVGNQHLVVARGAMTVNGADHRSDDESGVVVLPVAPSQFIATNGCLDTAVSDVLDAEVPRAAGYFSLGCGNDVRFVIVLPHPDDPPSTEKSLVLERVDGRWVLHGPPTAELCPTLPLPGPATCAHIVNEAAFTSTTS